MDEMCKTGKTNKVNEFNSKTSKCKMKCDYCYWGCRYNSNCCEQGCWLNIDDNNYTNCEEYKEELNELLKEAYRESDLDWYTFITQDVDILIAECIKRCKEYTPLSLGVDFSDEDKAVSDRINKMRLRSRRAFKAKLNDYIINETEKNY